MMASWKAIAILGAGVLVREASALTVEYVLYLLGAIGGAQADEWCVGACLLRRDVGIRLSILAG